MSEILRDYIREQEERKEYRPVAVSIIFDGTGRVLLTKTPKENAQTPWSFPQGGVDPGESLSDATARELEEELPGINAGISGSPVYGFLRREVDAEVGRVDKRGFTKGKAYIFSILRYEGDKDFQINASEVAETRWLSVEEATKLLNLARPEKAVLLTEALSVAKTFK